MCFCRCAHVEVRGQFVGKKFSPSTMWYSGIRLGNKWFYLLKHLTSSFTFLSFFSFFFLSLFLFFLFRDRLFSLTYQLDYATQPQGSTCLRLPARGLYTDTLCSIVSVFFMKVGWKVGLNSGP